MKSVGHALLDEAYDVLDLARGTLLSATADPSSALTDWERLGDWLILAERMGAERVFFVQDDPVVVFSRLPEGASADDIVEVYRRAWCLARPRSLFLATEDELRVYSLDSPPPRGGKEVGRLRPLHVAKKSADVLEHLNRFHREQLELGTTFEGQAGRSEGRADTQLLRDVRMAAEALVAEGLSSRMAHALIERVILVRYLEDRGVVTRDYFEEAAEGEPDWRQLLPTADARAVRRQSSFVACLGNRDFAYRVFERLAQDFNGDLFIPVPHERRDVRSKHLRLIQGLLSGAGVERQGRLFLWAYDFDVVPTTLISSMYEQFYRQATDDESGTHYTSAELVEYVLAQALPSEVLDQRPRICDPACGSGIFLVEAFRLMVRHDMVRAKQSLSSAALKQLLLERLAGVDINEEAIRLAAFSLYLAYLNYQSPQDIRQAGPLPRLIHDSGPTTGTGVLVVADAFAPLDGEADGLAAGEERLPWPLESFDIVIGNPPWDRPKKIVSRHADAWAKRRQLPVIDRNTSQLFLWRTLDLLRPGGSAAMLVSATVIHNARSRPFRQAWLKQVRLQKVVNFTHARRSFFSGATAPFFLLQFSIGDPTSAFGRVLYRTLRPSLALQATRSLAYARSDRRWVDQGALSQRDYLWKVYAWGSHHDVALLSRLDAEQTLGEFVPSDPRPGYGYQRGTQKPTRYLSSLKSLRRFESWGPLEAAEFERPPQGASRQPDERLYSGQRLIVAVGARAGVGLNVRLETVPFSVRHITYVIPLSDVPAWQAKTILAVMLSALGRYRVFMTDGSWGVWHDSIRAEALLGIPVRFAGPRSNLTKRLTTAVDRLHSAYPSATLSPLDVTNHAKVYDLGAVLADIDKAVFDLFQLSEAEECLVTDWARFTLDFQQKGVKSSALAPVPTPPISHGTADGALQSDLGPLTPYLRTFLKLWNRELAPHGELDWQVLSAPGLPLIGVAFHTRERDADYAGHSDQALEWADVLARLSAAQEDGTWAGRDLVLRSVSETSILIVKRSEARLWSGSAAREDVEATFLQAMRLSDR